MKLNCLIIDDEPLARKGLEEYVKEVPFLHLAGACENAMKASVLLKSESIDLMLLDIQMPKLSGIDFLKTLKDPPLVIAHAAISTGPRRSVNDNVLSDKWTVCSIKIIDRMASGFYKRA
jgi:response regulator of citrate/malate metabolism